MEYSWRRALKLRSMKARESGTCGGGYMSYERRRIHATANPSQAEVHEGQGVGDLWVVVR
jgi:hypothetical protein